MRYALAALLVLSACNAQPSGSGASAAAPPELATATEAPLVTGLMGGFSEAATGELSGLEVRAGEVQFAHADGPSSIAARTEFLGAADPASIAAGGRSFAAIAATSSEVRVEVRRVIAPAPQSLCWGDAPASYLALVHDEPLTALTLLVFSGADEPGPDARETTFCVSYSYAVD